MPDLDVSDLILDPDFADSFTVTRQVQTVGTDGRVTITPSTLNLIGVVTIGSLQPFQQGEDYVNSTKVITVHCQERLIDPITGYSPDVVTYDGDTYLVKKTYNWSRYGRGFYAAECEQQSPVGAA